MLYLNFSHLKSFVGWTLHTASVSEAPFPSPLYTEDEKLAWQLQGEENELASRAEGVVEKDAQFSATLAVDTKDPIASDPHNPTPVPKYRPGVWGARFATLSLEDTPAISPGRPHAGQTRGQELSTEAERRYSAAEREVVRLGREGNVARIRKTAAAAGVDESRDVHDVAKAALAGAQKEQAQIMKAEEPEVSKAELEIRRTGKVVAGAEHAFQAEDQKMKSADETRMEGRGRREQLGRDMQMIKESKCSQLVKNPQPAHDPMNRTLKSINQRHGPVNQPAATPAPAAVPTPAATPTPVTNPRLVEFAQMTAQCPGLPTAALLLFQQAKYSSGQPGEERRAKGGSLDNYRAGGMSSAGAIQKVETGE